MASENTEQVFVGDTDGLEDYAAFFEANDRAEDDTPMGGFLYISDRRKEGIIRCLEIYNKPALGLKEDAIQIFWSDDQSKCGVAIWGQTRGIINLSNGQERVALLDNRYSLGIADAEWLRGFNSYLDENHFIRARQRYWKDMVNQHENVEPLPEEQSPTRTNFIR